MQFKLVPTVIKGSLIIKDKPFNYVTANTFLPDFSNTRYSYVTECKANPMLVKIGHHNLNKA